MNNILFFTTFNKDGYNLYGKAWIKTFIDLTEKNKNIKAKIYCEDFIPDIVHNSIEYLNFSENISEHFTWKVRYLRETQHRNYTKKMTVRFSHKAFVIQHALENNNDDYVVWLDGDCIFKLSDYTDFPKNILNEKLLACQVEGQLGTEVKHVESGVLIFDNKHEDKQKFLQTFKNLYDVETIIRMPNDSVDYGDDTIPWKDYGPYDGFIIHKTLKTSNIDFINLNQGILSTHLAGEPTLTFKHTELNSKFIHNIGHSGKNDYIKWNSQLGIDENFDWNNEKTNDLSELNHKDNESMVADVIYRNKNFKFHIHNPTKDLVVSAGIYLDKHWEPFISDIILDAMKPNGIFVDIGANIGWHSKVVLDKGYRVIAFEPQPENFEILKKNCGGDLSTLYNIALGHKNDVVKFYKDPGNFGNSYIDEQGDNIIEVKKIDDIISSNLIERVNVVKMDVQGYETNIINGGLNFFNSLKKGTLIILEVSPHRHEFDKRVLIRQLVQKCSSSYALCHWENFSPVTFEKALEHSLNNKKDSLEFDLILTK